MTDNVPAGQDLHVELDPASWALLQDQIKGFGPKLQTEMQDRLKKLGDDIVADARAKLLSGPGSRGDSRGWGSHNSRQQAAAGLAAKVSAGSDGQVAAEVSIDASSMAPGRQAFPFAYDKRGGWNHPVFGHSGTPWVHQQGVPFLDSDDLAAKYADRLVADMGDALDDAAGTVKGSS
jgi:hypothetical protein